MALALDIPASDEDAPAAGPRPARRSVWVLGLWGAGIVVGREFARAGGAAHIGSWVWMLAAFVLVIAGARTRGAWCRGLLGAAVVVLGIGWWTLRIEERPASDISRHILAATGADSSGGAGAAIGSAVMTVEGVVMDSPRRLPAPAGALGAWSRAAPGWVMRVRVSGVEVGGSSGARVLPASGRLDVVVRSEDPVKAAAAGARVRMTGEVEPLRGAMNPGEPDARSLSRQEGRSGRMEVPRGEMVEPSRAPARLGDRAWSAWCAAVGGMRARAELALDRAAGGADAGPNRERRVLLGAMVLGEHDPALAEVSAAFQRLGLVHLVAISGFNLVLLAGFALWTLRLTGDRGWVEPCIVGVVVVMYLLVLPVNAPVLRAGLMVLGMLLAEAMGRRYDRVSTLAWIGVALTVWRPADLFDAGFQLSMGVVAALLLLGRAFHARLFAPGLRGVLPPPSRGWLVDSARGAWMWVSGMVTRLISTSVLAWVIATPLVMHHVGIVSPLAVVATLVVLPLTMLALLAGYGALVIGAVWPGAAAWIGPAVEEPVGWLIGAVELIDGLPGMSVRVPRIGAAWCAGATMVCAWWVWKGTWRSWRGVLATAAVGAWLGALVWHAEARGGLGRGVSARVDTLAVGDGTCHLIRAADGGAALWDCGSTWSGVGVRRIPDAVRALGARRVETVVVTHANFDHYSGLLDVAGPLGVRRVIVTGAFVHAAATEGGAPGALADALRSRGVEVLEFAAGNDLRVGSGADGAVMLRFLRPPPGARASGDGAMNDTSLVALLDAPAREGAGRGRMLFTGDIGPDAIAALMAGEDDVRADAVEAPHHGSVNAPAMELVRMTGAAVVVQSTGPRRAGDPRWDAVRAGRGWLTTATDGAAWVEFGLDGSVRWGSLRGGAAEPAAREGP